MSGMLKLLFAHLKLPSPSAIDGRTVLITGASTGLGLEAARHAARLGAGTIILGVRSVAKGEAAKADIEATTGCADKTNLLVWAIDLESFASVQAFAARAQRYVLEEGGRLDMAIMNAGMASMQFARSADGWEKSLQVNVLSTALLSLHLMPLLLSTSSAALPGPRRAHLAIVTSDIHMMIKFPERHLGDRILHALNDEEQWQQSQAAGGPTERYGVTKLMDLLLAQHLATMVPRDATSGEPVVIVNSLTPGFCKSDLLTREEAPWMLKLVQALVARTSEEGSKTLLDAATRGVETHGKYLDHEAVVVPGPMATDANAPALGGKLWREIIAILEDVDPNVPTKF